jgi:hypothetical protein
MFFCLEFPEEFPPFLRFIGIFNRNAALLLSKSVASLQFESVIREWIREWAMAEKFVRERFSIFSDSVISILFYIV